MYDEYDGDDDQCNDYNDGKMSMTVVMNDDHYEDDKDNVDKYCDDCASEDDVGGKGGGDVDDDVIEKTKFKKNVI